MCKTKDGEASIPRRIFYDVCKVYRPYAKEIMATFTRLFISFALMIIIFALIIKFQIFEEFSEVGETMLTIATATLPSVLGMLKSETHQELSDQRRESHLRTWLEKITTTRKVNLNLNKPTKRGGQYVLIRPNAVQCTAIKRSVIYTLCACGIHLTDIRWHSFTSKRLREVRAACNGLLFVTDLGL